MPLRTRYTSRCVRRWFDLPKPTIAQVHGKTIAGGLMLMWVCDLIVAADDALFADPTLEFGVNGVEWFAHPWELGHRKAKEFLFTGEFLSAQDAQRLGMGQSCGASRRARDVLLRLSHSESQRSRPFALQLAKQSINQALDAQGFWTAQQAAFGLQHVGHSHTRELHLRKQARRGPINRGRGVRERALISCVVFS